MREKGSDRNDLFDRLAADDRLGLTADDLAALVAEPLSFTGAAADQVDDVVRRVESLVAANPEAARYRPTSIL